MVWMPRRRNCAEQEVKFESQDKEKMEMDNLWLQVKGEIKEEIEQEQTCKSSSLDDLTPEENHDERGDGRRSQAR